MDLTDLDGVAEGRASNMKEAGYESLQDVAEADAETLSDSVNYLPEDTALELVVQAGDMVDEERNTPEVSEDDAETSDEEDGPLPGELAESSEDDSDGEESGVEDESPDESDETYTLTVDLETDDHYDAYMTALFNAVEKQSNQVALDALNSVLDDARYNGGEVSHEVTEYELNTMHAAVSQQVTEYKGQNMIGHMDAMRDILAQVNEVRQEQLF